MYTTGIQDIRLKHLKQNKLPELKFETVNEQ